MIESARFLRSNPLAVLGALVLVAMLAAVLIGPLVDPYSPTRLDILHKLAGPGPRHWLGSDSLGRDVLTRVLYGGRYTLAIGIGVVALAFVVGVFFGTVAGFAGGIIDNVIMRVVDAIYASARDGGRRIVL